jgi:DNA-binding response OmpR family regulator
MKKKILVVDDNLMALETFCQALELQGFSVDAHCTPTKALAEFSAERHWLIISDYCMPQMDGAAFCREIKQVDHQIPIVLYTGFPDTTYYSVLTMENVKGFLKPLELREILKHINQLKQQTGGTHA